MLCNPAPNSRASGGRTPTGPRGSDPTHRLSTCRGPGLAQDPTPELASSLPAPTLTPKIGGAFSQRPLTVWDQVSPVIPSTSSLLRPEPWKTRAAAGKSFIPKSNIKPSRTRNSLHARNRPDESRRASFVWQHCGFLCPSHIRANCFKSLFPNARKHFKFTFLVRPPFGEERKLKVFFVFALPNMAA